MSVLTYSLPPWLEGFEKANFALCRPDDAARMEAVIGLARHNVQRGGGGPFAAAVFAQHDGRFVASGVNVVTTAGASHLHAEVVALARAEKILGVYNLAKAGSFTLYTSVAPCVMCFGVIFWSGVARLVCGATTKDAESIGFDEGPKPADWARRLRGRGISVTQNLRRGAASAVLQEYARAGGAIYNPTHPA